jgi:hypothetical protein
VTFTLPEPINVPANIVRVDVAVPLAGRVRLVRLIDHPVQPGQRGGGITDTVKVPVKPPRLVNVMVELP